MNLEHGHQDPASTLDDGQWMVTQLDQIVATFFLPLAEPIGLPSGTPITTYLPMNKPAIDALEVSGVELTYAPMHDPTKPTVNQTPDQRRRSKDATENWTNKCTLSSSIMVHQVATDPTARSGIDAVAVVTSAVSGERFDPRDVNLTTMRGAGVSNDWAAREFRELGVGQVTVLEAAVDLRLIGSVPNWIERMEQPLQLVHRPDGPDDISLAPDLWPFADTTGTIGPRVQQRLYWALSVALEDARNIQKAYHNLTRQPITMLTRERLPFLLPIALRRLRDFGKPDDTFRAMVQVNENLWALLAPEPLPQDKLAAFSWVRSHVDGHAFSAHLDLHREADAALRRQGDTRVAVLLAAVAAESLLDELLLHMKWEEGTPPEEAARAWIDGLAARVKREYASRLGGQWDLGTGVIGEWETKVAALRHRVVHAAYLPNVDEASTSIQKVNELVSYLCDRLAVPDRLSRYPRTALALAGESGLSRRGSFTKRVQQLQQSLDEPAWGDTFARWRDAHNRVRRDLVEGMRSPDWERAHLLLVRRADGSLDWCLHDRVTALAIRVEMQLDDVPLPQRQGIIEALRQFAESEPATSMSLSVERNPDRPLRLSGAWQEEYHLVPLAEVMVDESDFSTQSDHQIPQPD